MVALFGTPLAHIARPGRRVAPGFWDWPHFFPPASRRRQHASPCAQRRRLLHVFLAAGEPSGDMLGAAVMRSMRRRVGGDGIHFTGIGGEEMLREGLVEVFPSADLAVMGLLELIPHLARCLVVLLTCARRQEEQRPDILLTIDAKGFNFRLLRALAKGTAGGRRDRQMTVVHYVAPSIWAYKGSHAGTLGFVRSHIDLLLVLFPFETRYWTSHAKRVQCVGPAVLESASVRNSLTEERGDARSASSQGGLLLLPGSRRQEIERNLPDMISAAELVASGPSRTSPLQVTILTLAPLVPLVKSMLSPSASISSLDISVTSEPTLDGRLGAMRQSDAAIAVSGTVTLELAAAGTPCVIVYKAHWLTGMLAGRLAAVSHVGLPNLLILLGGGAGEAPIPELLFAECRPDQIAAQILPLLDPEGARASGQRASMRKALRLACPRQGGEVESPADIAARAILEAHGAVLKGAA